MREVLKAGSLIEQPEITPEELQLAVRNHSMPVEALHYDVTPLGLHYLLIHFDIPAVDVSTWRLNVGGLVQHPLQISLDDIKSRPARTLAVTLECAGNGRARLSPRPQSQPWLGEAVGNAEWTGTSLWALVEDAVARDDATDVVFTGLDRGVQGEIEQQYERSLPIGEAMRDEVLLAYAINGQPLPPQHGFPLRLIVPGWYGMTHVKWLRSISLVKDGFDGYQQARAYHFRTLSDERGVPVTRILPRALMVPPGIPDFMTRTRFVEPGPCPIEGRAWSGRGAIAGVEFSSDGGMTWSDAALQPAASPFGWRRWTFAWTAEPGEHDLCVRATDDAGNAQPLEQNWNLEGVQNNAVQRVRVVAGSSSREVQKAADREP